MTGDQVLKVVNRAIGNVMGPHTIGIAAAFVILSQTAAFAQVTLLCSGTLFTPTISKVAGSISGSVKIDYQSQTVSGIISGPITNLDDRSIDFAGTYVSFSDGKSLIYRYGHFDRITGKAWQYDSRNKTLPLTEIADYSRFDLSCKPEAPLF
jgi:hypothetical protein